MMGYFVPHAHDAQASCPIGGAEPSKDADMAAREIGARLAPVPGGVGPVNGVPREVATVDAPRRILARERLNALPAGVLERNEAFTAIPRDTADESEAISAVVASPTAGLRFRYRIAKRLPPVIKASRTPGQAMGAPGNDAAASGSGAGIDLF